MDKRISEAHGGQEDQRGTWWTRGSVRHMVDKRISEAHGGQEDQ